MLKKLLILPILWSILWLGAFASANSINWIISDTDIYTSSFEGDYFSLGDNMSWDNINEDNYLYVCFSSSDYPYIITYNADDSTYNVNSSSYCFSSPFYAGDESFSFSKSINWIYYQSATLMSLNSSDSWNSDSSLIPNIPSSFTIWLTSLVSNFGSIIVNWLPTIILLSLGIYVIFALFRVVRWYAKSSFNW